MRFRDVLLSYSEGRLTLFERSRASGKLAADSREKEGRAKKLQPGETLSGRGERGDRFITSFPLLSVVCALPAGCAPRLFRFIYKLLSYLSPGTIGAEITKQLKPFFLQRTAGRESRESD